MFKQLMVITFTFAILISLKFQVNGQCEDKGDHNTVTSCDGSTRSERGIYADFDKIGGPCTCIVTSLFNGYLYVVSHKAAHVLCNNRVRVNNTVIFDCKDDGFKKFNVKFNDTIIIKAEYQPGHTFGRFYQCLVFINYDYKYNKLSVRCGPHQPTTSSTTTSTVSYFAPRFPKKSSESIVSSTEFKVAINNKNSVRFSTSLNTSTADLNSSSNDPTTIDAKLKKDAYFTTAHVLNTSTADLKSSLQESMNTNPENISVLTSIATGGIVLALALIVCIIILLNRIMKEGNGSLVLKSATAHTNRTFENNNGLPINPLNNVSKHADEVQKSSALNQQLGLPQTASKINQKNNSDYDIPANNKPVDQGVYSMAKNVVPNKSDELCSDVINEDVYAQVFKQNNSNPLAPVQARNLHDDELFVIEVEIETTAVKQSNSMDNSECNDRICYAKVNLA